VLKTVRGAMRDDPEINAVEFRSAPDSDRKGTKPAVCGGFHQWAEPGITRTALKPKWSRRRSDSDLLCSFTGDAREVRD
jgi:hypothetical protein